MARTHRRTIQKKKKKDLHEPDNHDGYHDHSPRVRHPGMQSSKEKQGEIRKPFSVINAKK